MNLRALYVWMLIAAVESAHGLLRQLFLEVRFGDRATHQIGVAVGSWLVFVIALATIKWMRVRQTSALLAVGAIWAILTFSLEAILSRVFVHRSLDQTIADYDPNRGGLMLVGLIVTAIAPLAAARLRGIKAERVSLDGTQ